MNAKLSTLFVMYEKFIRIRVSTMKLEKAFFSTTRTSTTKTFAINENKFHFLLHYEFLHVDSHKFESSHAMHKFSLLYHSLLLVPTCQRMQKKIIIVIFFLLWYQRREIYVKLNIISPLPYFFPTWLCVCIEFSSSSFLQLSDLIKCI